MPAGAIIGSAAVNAYFADKASRRQTDVTREGIEENRRQFDLTRADTAHLRDASQVAIGDLRGDVIGATPETFDPGAFEAAPGYQFRLDQGNQGVSNYLAGKGMKLSGRALKEVARYNQGFASNEYDNFFKRKLTIHQQNQQNKQNAISNKFQLAGLGAAGINTAASAGSNYVANNTALTRTLADAEANRYAGYNNSIQQGLSNYYTYKAAQGNQNNNSSVQGDANYPAATYGH